MKASDKMQIEIYEINNPRGSEGSTIGKPILHVFIFAKFFLKINLSRTSLPILISLGTNHPSMMRIQVCSNKGPDCLEGDKITKMEN
jgi:hypothetical protein